MLYRNTDNLGQLALLCDGNQFVSHLKGTELYFVARAGYEHQPEMEKVDLLYRSFCNKRFLSAL